LSKLLQVTIGGDDGERKTPLCSQNAREEALHERELGSEVWLLLEQKGVDPESKIKGSLTALHQAAQNGHGAVVKLLLSLHRWVPGLSETVLDKGHPNTLTSVNNLALV
jgi:ankyrin repeat protein